MVQAPSSANIGRVVQEQYASYGLFLSCSGNSLKEPYSDATLGLF